MLVAPHRSSALLLCFWGSLAQAESLPLTLSIFHRHDHPPIVVNKDKIWKMPLAYFLYRSSSTESTSLTRCIKAVGLQSRLRRILRFRPTVACPYPPENSRRVHGCPKYQQIDCFQEPIPIYQVECSLGKWAQNRFRVDEGHQPNLDRQKRAGTFTENPSRSPQHGLSDSP